MISLLTQRLDIKTKDIKHYKLNYATRLIREYLKIIRKYYRNSGFYVKRPNKLVTLIEELNINIHDSEQDVFFSLKDKADYVSNELGFIDGREFNSDPFMNTVFDNVPEYFITASDMKKGLTCIYSNVNTLFLTHPKRYERIYDGDAYNIYVVDPVKLGMEYYKWANKELENNPETYSIDPAKFIYVKSITDTIPDIFKYGIFNRYVSLFYNRDLEPFSNYNPFYIKDIDPLITSIQNWYIDEIEKNSNITYQELLSILTDFNNGNMLDVYAMPNVFFNRKSYWVLFLSRVDYFSFMLDIVDKKRNKASINDLKIWLKLAKRNNYFNVPNYTLRYIIEEKLTNLKNKL